MTSPSTTDFAMRARTKPLLRGVSHELAAVALLPAVLVLVIAAREGTARVAAVV